VRLVLVGGNPKGYSIPFHPSTRSGKILRNIISKLSLDCDIVDMTKNTNDIPTSEEIRELQKRFNAHQVVFLGRFVERALKHHFHNGIYLPHPASRRKKDIERLENGLRQFSVYPSKKKGK